MAWLVWTRVSPSNSPGVSWEGQQQVGTRWAESRETRLGGLTTALCQAKQHSLRLLEGQAIGKVTVGLRPRAQRSPWLDLQGDQDNIPQGWAAKASKSLRPVESAGDRVVGHLVGFESYVSESVHR